MATGARKFNYKHHLRRTHRYLGVFTGIQFIFLDNRRALL